jgi:hypothetical protein
VGGLIVLVRLAGVVIATTIEIVCVPVADVAPEEDACVAARQVIVTGAPGDPVGAVTAVQMIPPGRTVKRVTAAAPREVIGARSAAEVVVAATSYDKVAPLVARGPVVAPTPADEVTLASTEDHVVPAEGRDHVTPGRPGKAIVALRAGDRRRLAVTMRPSVTGRERRRDEQCHRASNQ